jgi:hypothetical protein
MPRKIKTKTKEPAGPPPDAPFLGIPPEMRNAIYRLVADEIYEVSIIGCKLDRSKATSKDHAWLWDTMAKHPLSQTCRQLRQEFDPVHQRRALTTGLTRYRLELEDFDVERISEFARTIRFMPGIIKAQLKQTVDRDDSIFRFNLSNRVCSSVRKLKRRWRGLDSIFSNLQRDLDVTEYSMRRSYEVNLNFRDQTMSSARKKFTPTQDQVASAKREFKKFSEDISQSFLDYGTEWLSACVLELLYRELNNKHNKHFRPLREAREERANTFLKNRLASELKANLREELKVELRAEIMNELKEEAGAELERQIQEGLEGWSTGDVPEN